MRLKVPRIVLQATLLAQQHKLSIWYRPEPAASTIPRRATSSEEVLASIFTRYLEALIENAPEDVVSFDPGISQRTVLLRNQQTVCSPSDRLSGSPAIELRVQTPQFFRQMITCEKLTDFLSCTLLHPSEENHTAWSNDSKRLITLLENLTLRPPPCIGLRKVISDMVWNMYRRLHAPRPLYGAYPNPGLPNARAEVIEHPKITCKNSRLFLDDFVRDHYGLRFQMRYIFTTLSLRLRTWTMGVIGGE